MYEHIGFQLALALGYGVWALLRFFARRGAVRRRAVLLGLAPAAVLALAFALQWLLELGLLEAGSRLPDALAAAFAALYAHGLLLAMLCGLISVALLLLEAYRRSNPALNRSLAALREEMRRRRSTTRFFNNDQEDFEDSWSGYNSGWDRYEDEWWTGINE